MIQYVLIFAIGVLVYILPSLPSFFPIGRITDGAAHYAMVKHIVETNTILSPFDFPLFPEWSNYPQGFHLFTATISKLTGIDPITLIYPIIVVVFSLSVVLLFDITRRLHISEDRWLNTIPSLLVLMFYLSHDMIRVQDSWSMAFGIALVILFMWLLQRYLENYSIIKLSFLALIEIAIIYSYYFWALIPITMFALAVIFERRDLLIHFIFFLTLTGITTFSYILNVISAKSYVLFGKVSFVRFLPFDLFEWSITKNDLTIDCLINLGLTFFFALAIVCFLLCMWLGEYRFLGYFFGSVLLMAVVLWCGVAFFGFRAYPYSKVYYLMAFPASVYWLIWFKKLCIENGFEIERYSKSIVCFLVAGVFLSGLLVSLGVQASGNRELAFSPDQYDVALWCKTNLKGDNLTYIGVTPHDLWFYVVSGIPPSDSALVLGAPDGYLEWWLEDSKNGDIVVLLNLERHGWTKMPLNSSFDVLYRKGNAGVLIKEDYSLKYFELNISYLNDPNICQRQGVQCD